MRNSTHKEAAQDSNNEQLPKTLEFSKLEILCYKLIDGMDAKTFKKTLWIMAEGSITSPDSDFLTTENRYHVMSVYRSLSKFIKKVSKEIDAMKQSGVNIAIS